MRFHWIVGTKQPSYESSENSSEVKNAIHVLIHWLYDEEKVLDGPHKLE